MRARTRANARTHARTHASPHARTHARSLARLLAGGLYISFVAAMSGDCLHGGECRSLAISGIRYNTSAQGTREFESAEYERQMDESVATKSCTGVHQIDCHPYVRPRVRLCDGALTVGFVWAPDTLAADYRGTKSGWLAHAPYPTELCCPSFFVTPFWGSL